IWVIGNPPYMRRPSTRVYGPPYGTQVYDRLNRYLQDLVQQLELEPIDVREGARMQYLSDPYELINGSWQRVGHELNVYISDIGFRYADASQLDQIIRQSFAGPFNLPGTS